MATGTLSEYVLSEGDIGSADWKVPGALDRILAIFEAIPNFVSLNEAQTRAT